MKPARMFVLTIALSASALATGCGEKGSGKAHPAAVATPAPAAPTPDTTPIEALRTPAGLVLKAEPPTPTPGSAK